MLPHKVALPYFFMCLLTIVLNQSSPIYIENIRDLKFLITEKTQIDFAYIIEEQVDTVRSHWSNGITKFRCFIVKDVIEAELFSTPADFFVTANKCNHCDALIFK